MVSKNHINAILRGDFNDLQNNVKRQSVAYTSKAHNNATSTTTFGETMPFTIFNSPRNLVGQQMRDSTTNPSESVLDEDMNKTQHSRLPTTASNAQNKFEPNAFRNYMNVSLHKATKVAKFDD